MKLAGTRGAVSSTIREMVPRDRRAVSASRAPHEGRHGRVEGVVADDGDDGAHGLRRLAAREARERRRHRVNQVVHREDGFHIVFGQQAEVKGHRVMG